MAKRVLLGGDDVVEEVGVRFDRMRLHLWVWRTLLF
jgi:hypothetical protein